MSQLALPLQLEDHAVFESFWPAGNEQVLSFLRRLAAGGDGPGCWLWGPLATGKTHLLQAICGRLGDRSMYLPVRDLLGTSPDILEGLAERPFLCLDDVEAASGNAAWERALFNLYNASVEPGAVLVIAASAPPRDAGFALADLRSRFSRLPAFYLRALGEEDRQKALQLRASHRGLELPVETARYLLTRSRRDMASLYALLDRLDAEALVAQRRLTIPFVRDVIDT